MSALTPRQNGHRAADECHRDTNHYTIELDEANKASMRIDHVYCMDNGECFYRGTVATIMVVTTQYRPKLNSDGTPVVNKHGQPVHKKECTHRRNKYSSWLNPKDRAAFKLLDQIPKYRDFDFEEFGTRRVITALIEEMRMGFNHQFNRPSRHQFQEEQVYMQQLASWKKANEDAIKLWTLWKALIWSAVLPGKEEKIIKTVVKLELPKLVEPPKKELDVVHQDEKGTILEHKKSPDAKIDLQKLIAKCISQSGGSATVTTIVEFCKKHGWKEDRDAEFEMRWALGKMRNKFLRVDPSSPGQPYLYTFYDKAHTRKQKPAVKLANTPDVPV